MALPISFNSSASTSWDENTVSSLDSLNSLNSLNSSLENLSLKDTPTPLSPVNRRVAAAAASTEKSVTPVKKFIFNTWPKNIERLELKKVDNCNATVITHILQEYSYLLDLSLLNQPSSTFFEIRDYGHTYPNIRKLFLDESMLTTTELSVFLGMFPELEQLSLKACPAVFRDGVKLVLPKTLRELDVSDTLISEDILVAAELEKLEHLDVSGCSKLSKNFFKQLQVPSSLRSFSACETEIEGLALDRIFKNVKLREVYLLGCGSITKEAFAELRYPSKLKVVDVRDTNIDIIGLRQIGMDCNQIGKIHTDGCKNLPKRLRGELDTYDIENIRIRHDLPFEIEL